MSRYVWRLSAALALVIPVGCGEDGGSEPQGSIAIAASPSSLTLTQGQSGTITVTLTRGGGFADPVTIAVEGLPSGVTTSVSPTSLTGTTTQAIVTVNVGSAVAPGTSTATIRASATGVGAATAQYSLTVTAPPDYSLSATPAALTIAAGGNATTTVNISRTNFTSPVSLSLASPPAGVTATFNPAAPNGTSSTATISIATTVVPGSYNVTIMGAAQGVPSARMAGIDEAAAAGDRTTTVAVTVTPAPAFTISAAPNVVSAVTGGSGVSTVSIARTNLTADVALSLLNAPLGVTGVFTPPTLTGATLTSSLAINIGTTVTPGTYLIAVQGAAGALLSSVPIALTVAAQSTGFTTTPTLLSIQRGSTGTATLTVSRVGFSGSIVPAVSGNPPGMTVTFSPNPITGNSSTVTVSVGSNVAAGTYNVVIDASGVPGIPSTTLVVIVTSAGGSGGANIVWEFCNSEPLPIKFWRKSNGSWSEVTGTVTGSTTRYEFTATGNDAGIAFTRQIFASSPGMSAGMTRPRANVQQVARQAREGALSARAVARKQKLDPVALVSPYHETVALYAVSTELAGHAQTCANPSAPVSKTFTVAGMSSSEAGVLGYGGGATVLTSGQASYNVMVPPGTYDYLAAFGPQPTAPDLARNWTHYRIGRGETAPGPAVAINRSGATPFVAAPFAITGGTPGSFYAFVHSIRSARGSIIDLPLGSPSSTTAAGNMLFVAPGDRLSTDMNVFLASNSALLGANDISSRAVAQFFGSTPPGGTTTLALPPALPNYAMTMSGSSPYPTWRATGSIPAPFQTEVGSITTSYQGGDEATLWFVSATRNWLISQGMATDYAIAGPAGLPGFQNQWAPVDPLIDGTVTIFSSNISGGVPVPGSVNITSSLFKSPP